MKGLAARAAAQEGAAAAAAAAAGRPPPPRRRLPYTRRSRLQAPHAWRALACLLRAERLDERACQRRKAIPAAPAIPRAPTPRERAVDAILEEGARRLELAAEASRHSAADEIAHVDRYGIGPMLRTLAGMIRQIGAAAPGAERDDEVRRSLQPPRRPQRERRGRGSRRGRTGRGSGT